MRKRAPKDIIKGSYQGGSKERTFVKIPGQEVRDVTLESLKYLCSSDPDLVDALNLDNKKGYTCIHTHPVEERQYTQGMGSIPSSEDFSHFLADNEKKTMVVVQQNPETGDIEGYYLFRKTKGTQRSPFDFPTEYRRFLKDEKYGEEFGKVYVESAFAKPILEYRNKAFGGPFSTSQPPKQRQEALDELVRTFNLKARYLPAKGFRYDSGTKFSPLGIESKVAAVIALGLISLLSFFSGPLTGKVIKALGGSSILTSITLGGLLILLSLIAYSYLKLSEH